jgi:glycosyltransferase involved in cell wall biosynthesis
MKKLFIVDIEPLDNRYTKQWHTWVPKLAQQLLSDKFEVHVITGDGQEYLKPQAGAFFDFASTCFYKADQAKTIAHLFKHGEVKAGDVFFFTDAWNQTIHTVRYISELNEIPVKCAGIWHAGWYDPTDILGIKIKNVEWVRHLEMSMVEAYDLNFFGTVQHMRKFQLKHLEANKDTMVVCGYPLEYIRTLENTTLKTNTVVFPHRLNEDKAPWLFDKLEQTVHDMYGRTDIKFVKTQEQGFSKEQYYDFLKTCKVVFSANKHENLGIGTFEAMTAGCIPIVPNKLSYAEMYNDIFKYNIDEEADIYNFPDLYMESLGKMVINFVDNYDTYQVERQNDVTFIQRNFFDGTDMMEQLRKLG